MGVYNSLYIECPHCEGILEAQGKAGPDDCAPNVITLHTPLEGMEDIDSEYIWCERCDKSWIIRARTRTAQVNDIRAVSS